MSDVFFYSDGTRYRFNVDSADFDNNMSASWKSYAATQYANLVSAFNASNRAIPFFISTDQHGGNKNNADGNRWLAGNDSEIGFVRNFNLGDLGDKYSKSTFDGWYERTYNIPYYFSLPGNHDYNKNGTTYADYNVMNRDFCADGDKRIIDQKGFFSLYDWKRNVKYLAIQPYTIDTTKTAGWRLELGTKQVNWLISELEAKDSMDIIVISHMPTNGTYTNLSGESVSHNDFSADFRTILEAYRAKGSGTFTDELNVSHSYDFSDTNGNLLCTLHGHTHSEEVMTKNTLVSFCADYYAGSYACTFGLIDRDNNVLKTWRFDNNQAFSERQFSLGLS